MSTVTLDQVSARAREIDVRRALLTAVAAVLWSVGWLVGRTVTMAVAAVLWSVAAVSLGWRDARPVRDGQQRLRSVA